MSQKYNDYTGNQEDCYEVLVGFILRKSSYVPQEGFVR
jgi:hypothetical protein